jgi:DNA repair ATPase RecN
MSEYATKKDVQEIVDKAVNDLSAVMSQFANDVNDRFDKVDARFERIEERLEKLEDSHNKYNRCICR